MAYADYAYYTTGYLLGRAPAVPEEDFPFWEKQAEKELDRYTFDRLRANPGLVSDEVKDCVCALTELLYKADRVSLEASEKGLAGPLVSWSNDGESGSVDLGQSVYTESGKQAKIKRLIALNLGNTGLLYAGVCCC